MTSLPITLPPGFSPIVKKGDKVKSGQLLAKKVVGDQGPLVTDSKEGSDLVIDLAVALSSSPNAVRKFLKKAPGDSLTREEVIAEKPLSLGLKKELVISQTNGTVIRYERDSGRLYVRSEDALNRPTPTGSPAEILSPLAGTISVCNNDQIVLETESKAYTGSAGFGGTITGDILILSPGDDQLSVTSAQITKEAIGKILVLPDIEIEALVKADAIGVAGILGTELSKDLITYLESGKVGLVVVTIDSAMGKKLLKTKHPVTVHGEQKSVLLKD